MDSKTRVERIARKLADSHSELFDKYEIPLSADMFDELYQVSKKALSIELDEAVREAVESQELYRQWSKENWQAGFAAARKKAAGIAEKGPRPGGILYCDGDVRDPGVVVTGYQKWIAERIRAMEEK